MEKVKIGVLGGYRGSSMINYCNVAQNAEVVAICDNNEFVLNTQKEMHGDKGITFYDSFDEFINHDMEAVVLANYANEHAPFAIKCMERGLHVFSEVLPVQTMKEAVELVETVERTGMTYAYGENYCYMAAPYEMRKLYQQGELGEFQYGEGEYIHNCESIWPSITYGDKNHWRNNMYATFYCTHSLGPIIHITGLRPVKVVGFEGTQNAKSMRNGSKSGLFGIEMVTFENGGIAKSIHGGLYKNSVWYSIYGSKGRMESAREDAENGDVSKLYVNCDKFEGEYKENKPYSYDPKFHSDEMAKSAGHSGSDFYCMYNFVEYLKGNKEYDIIDVYEALDMFLPGMFAYRSVLNGGISMDIPNLRDKQIREQFRNDTMCTDPNVAGEMLIPCFSKGNPDIPDSVYEIIKKKWDNECENGSEYIKSAFTQGEIKTEEK